MKKLMVILLALCAVHGAGALGVSLAVTQVEPIGVGPEVARTVEELLQTEFAQIPVFQVVERGRLDAVLDEQALQLSGITDADTAARAGNVLNVQKVLFGSISLYESQYVKYLLSLRLVDVETASVEGAETVQVRNQEALLPAIREIVKRLSAGIEVVGRVTRVDEGVVYTSLGEAAGMGPEAVLSVFKIDLIKDDQGRVVMREETPVANLVVEKASPEGSRCRVLAAAAPIETGFAVRQGKAELEREQSRGTLVVGSVPQGANVYLDSQFIGVTPMELSSLEPGRYTIEIRSGAGFKPYQGRVTLGAGRTVTLDRELERELEVEDLLLLGRIPRKPTDPATAVLRSLLPGWGMSYNGYGDVAPLIPFTVVMPAVVAFASFPEEGMFELQALKAAAEGGDVLAIWDYQRVRTRWIEDTMLFAWSFHTYATSIFDAWRTARQDFRYATYVELATGLSGVYCQRTQTEDSGSPVDPRPDQRDLLRDRLLQLRFLRGRHLRGQEVPAPPGLELQPWRQRRGLPRAGLLLPLSGGGAADAGPGVRLPDQLHHHDPAGQPRGGGPAGGAAEPVLTGPARILQDPEAGDRLLREPVRDGPQRLLRAQRTRDRSGQRLRVLHDRIPGTPGRTLLLLLEDRDQPVGELRLPRVPGQGPVGGQRYFHGGSDSDPVSQSGGGAALLRPRPPCAT